MTIHSSAIGELAIGVSALETDAGYLDLITSEHRDKPKFSATVSALVAPMESLQQFLATLPGVFDLDDAVGAQLDAVGVRVGRSRLVSTQISGVYFSWDTDSLGWEQGYWQGPYDPDSGIASLNDDTYRIILRAKIAANQWDGTLSTINDILAPILGDSSALLFIEDHQDMTASVCISGEIPSSLVLALISQEYIPVRPAGVKYDYAVTSENGSPIFGFDVDNDYIGGWDTGAWATAL